MPKPKYKEIYQKIKSEHQVLFDQFRPIHDGYKTDRKAFSQQFHAVGQEVVDLLRDAERRLCSSMERGQFALYSHKVSDKFWEEVKKDFSHVELVGVRSNLD